MTDKELIKQEIERNIVKEDNSITPDQAKHHTHYHIGRRELCDTLLQFVNSLPEEPRCEVNFTTKSDDLEEAAEKYAYNEFPSIGIPNTVIELAFKSGA